MSPQDAWYVRSRGRTQGPFPLARLIAMRDQGALARFHQVSQDQTDWVQAGSLPELFPAAAAQAPPGPGSGLGLAADPRPQPEIIPPKDLDQPWFYSESGSPVGPAPLADLLAMARTGELTPDSLVWNEGLPDWVAASTVSAFQHALGTTPRPGGSGGRSPIPFEQPAFGPRPTSGLAVAGFVAGLTSLLSASGFVVLSMATADLEGPSTGLGVLALAILAVGGIAGILGVVLNGLAMSQIGQSGGAVGGRGLAVTGLVFSVLGLVSAALIVVLGLMAAAALSSRR